MNGIDILWALLTLLSVILFISGDWLAQRKIRLLRPWFASRRRGVRAMSVVFAVALMSCLARLVL